MTAETHNFNGFAREIVSVLRPDLLQETGRESALTLDPGPDHHALQERSAMSHLTPIDGRAQAIPVVTCDAVIADGWLEVIRHLCTVQDIHPHLHDSPAWRSLRGYAQSRWESAFEVLG